MNSWFHTATLAKLKTPIGSPELREIHQLYTGQVPDMTLAQGAFPIPGKYRPEITIGIVGLTVIGKFNEFVHTVDDLSLGCQVNHPDRRRRECGWRSREQASD